MKPDLSQPQASDGGSIGLDIWVSPRVEGVTNAQVDSVHDGPGETVHKTLFLPAICWMSEL